MEKNNKKALIVYYSYTGNTKSIANIIKERLNCDIVEIKTVVPYSNNYDYVVELGEQEVKDKYKPEIEEIKVNLSEYKTIILGTPVWWYTIAPAVLTFLTKYDFKDVKIIPFATNGGWIGHTFKDIEKLCLNSIIEDPINIKYSSSKLDTDINTIYEWVDNIKDKN